MSRANDYTTGDLLEYFSMHYKLTAINLSKQIELENPDLKQQINFIGKLEEDIATIIFIIKKSEETPFSDSEESKFATKKWYVIDTQTAKDKYNQNNSIKFETETIIKSLPLF